MNRAERRASARGKTTVNMVQGRRWAAAKKANKNGRRTVASAEYKVRGEK